MVCNLCRKTVKDVRTGYFSCSNANFNCDYDCCYNCYKGVKPPQIDQEITIDSQLDALPNTYKSIVLKVPKTKIHSHEHNLKKNQGVRQGWNCNKIPGATRCMSGLTDFYQSDGMVGYFCEECGFDMCENCIKADIFIFKGL